MKMKQILIKVITSCLCFNQYLKWQLYSEGNAHAFEMIPHESTWVCVGGVSYVPLQVIRGLERVSF